MRQNLIKANINSRTNKNKNKKSFNEMITMNKLPTPISIISIHHYIYPFVLRKVQEQLQLVSCPLSWAWSDATFVTELSALASLELCFPTSSDPCHQLWSDCRFCVFMCATEKDWCAWVLEPLSLVVQALAVVYVFVCIRIWMHDDWF